MKKILCIFCLVFIFSSTLSVTAHPYYRSRYCSSGYYLVGSDYRQQEHKFANCNEHYMISETTVNYYSNGTRRCYTYHTIYNSDGTVLTENCSSVKHVFYNKKHYFIIKQGKFYKIINGNGEILTKRNYALINEITPNVLAVKYQKKYGIIDMTENIIVPIKYDKFEQVRDKIFITKLNGYYGLIDIQNNVLVKNECEKIVQLYDTFVLKKYGQYGLADENGRVILQTEFDKIKKLGEFILIKKDNLIGALDAQGKIICPVEYKKIKLERNNLKGKTIKNDWVIISEGL